MIQTTFYTLVSIISSVGIYLIFSEKIKLFLRSITNFFRKQNLKKNEFKIYSYFLRLWKTIFGKEGEQAEKGLQRFLLSCLATFIIIFSWLKRADFGDIASIFISIIIVLMPFAFLFLKLMNLHYKGSYEGEILISEILNSYKMNSYNMVEAIDKCQRYLDEAPICKKALFSLSLKLKAYSTEAELKKALEDFNYAIGTNWVIMLSNNIYMAIQENIIITKGLEDLLDNAAQINEMLEQAKRDNLEGYAMIRFLAPAMVVLLAYTAMSQLSYNLSEVLNYQFISQTGIKYTIAISIMAFITHTIVTILSRQKFDF
jgi:hypothetical protein